MQYTITWTERPMGSAADYEAAQKRILDVFGKWEFPESVTVHAFVVRVGEWGGLMLVETDDAAAIHTMTSTFPAFEFHVASVLPVADAIPAEMAAMAWRDELSP